MTARFRACRAQLCASGHGAPAAVPWTIGVLGTPVPHCDPCSPAVPPKRQKRRAGRRHQAKGALVPRLFRPRHQLGGADTNWDGGKPITDNHRWTQGNDQVKAGLHSATIPLYPPHPTSTQIPTQETREKVLTFRLSMGVTGVPTGGASGSPASIRIKTALRALHDGRPPSFYAAGARVRCPWREPRHTGTTT